MKRYSGLRTVVTIAVAVPMFAAGFAATMALNPPAPDLSDFMVLWLPPSLALWGFGSYVENKLLWIRVFQLDQLPWTFTLAPGISGFVLGALVWAYGHIQGTPL
jgi:hypothetical protein